MSHYDTLAIPPTANQRDISKAYRHLARIHHPDKHATASDTEKSAAKNAFMQLKLAYDTLIDPIKRSAYDKQLSTRTKWAAPRESKATSHDTRMPPPSPTRSPSSYADFRGAAKIIKSEVISPDRMKVVQEQPHTIFLNCTFTGFYRHTPPTHSTWPPRWAIPVSNNPLLYKANKIQIGDSDITCLIIALYPSRSHNINRRVIQPGCYISREALPSSTKAEAYSDLHLMIHLMGYTDLKLLKWEKMPKTIQEEKQQWIDFQQHYKRFMRPIPLSRDIARDTAQAEQQNALENFLLLACTRNQSLTDFVTQCAQPSRSLFTRARTPSQEFFHHLATAPSFHATLAKPSKTTKKKCCCFG